MENLETPQFCNSCGKIFDDRILLAFTNSEKELLFDSIKKADFITRPQTSSILFAGLPLLLLFFPFLTNQDDGFVDTILIITGLAFTVLAITKIERAYTLALKLKDGLIINVKVWEGNRKEALKFAGIINARIARLKI